ICSGASLPRASGDVMIKSSALDRWMSRRRFGAAVGSTLGAFVFGDACLVQTRTGVEDTQLTARPKAGVAASLASGPLGLANVERDGVVQVPSTMPDGPVPLLLFLHGATQSGTGMLRRIGPLADQAGVAVLAPDSRGTTWDAIRERFGDDVAFLNRALEH